VTHYDLISAGFAEFAILSFVAVTEKCVKTARERIQIATKNGGVSDELRGICRRA